MRSGDDRREGRRSLFWHGCEHMKQQTHWAEVTKGPEKSSQRV